MGHSQSTPDPAAAQRFLKTVTPDKRREDGLKLLKIFQEVSGYDPVMWGESIVGFGRYDYRYASGREGSYLATGFSPRKSALSLYIMPGYADFSMILKDLGKHKTGKSCLYINKLEDVDLAVLKRLIRAGLANLNQIWPVHPF